MLYRLLLFLHVSGAIFWVGSGMVFQVLSERALKTDTDRRARILLETAGAFGTWFYVGLTLLILGSGATMAWREWGFGQPFIIGGLIGLVASGALGAVVMGPALARLNEALAAGGDVRAPLARLRGSGRLDVAIMIVVVFLMTVKPGT